MISSYESLRIESRDIRNSLDDADGVLSNLTNFLATASYDDLFQNIDMLNLTIHSLEQQANASLEAIQSHYNTVMSNVNALNTILATASQELNNIINGENITSIADDVTVNVTSLTRNLSIVDESMQVVQQGIDSTNNSTDEAGKDIMALSSNLTQLTQQLNMLNSTLNYLNNITIALQLSATSVLTEAQMQVEMTSNLTVRASLHI